MPSDFINFLENYSTVNIFSAGFGIGIFVSYFFGFLISLIFFLIKRVIPLQKNGGK